MKILLVDSNRSHTDLIVNTFRDHNFFVAESLGKAMEWLSHTKFSLIFVNLDLPDSKGIETYKALALSPSPKVIITSAKELIKSIVKMGAHDYICSDDIRDCVARIGFNITKLQRQERFSSPVFEQIKACLEKSKVSV
jgi:DNA-binding response OmpR family regulator